MDALRGIEKSPDAKNCSLPSTSSAVRDHLASLVANGKLAQAEFKELMQPAERRRRLGFCKADRAKGQLTKFLFCSRMPALRPAADARVVVLGVKGQ